MKKLVLGARRGGRSTLSQLRIGLERLEHYQYKCERRIENLKSNVEKVKPLIEAQIELIIKQEKLSKENANVGKSVGN